MLSIIRRQLPLFWQRPKRTKRLAQIPQESSQYLSQEWRNLRIKYFPDRVDLDDYTVTWSSRRQKRTLASCNLRMRKVIVARELDHPDIAIWLIPVLYHELCHAVLGTQVRRTGKKRAWHGPEFKALVNRHPLTNKLDHWISSGGWSKAVRSARAGVNSKRRQKHF